MEAQDFRVHLINVSQDEAEASLDMHGPGICRCGKPPDAVFLMALPPVAGQPARAWGQGIQGFGCCAEHESEFLAEMAQISYKEGH